MKRIRFHLDLYHCFAFLAFHATSSTKKFMAKRPHRIHEEVVSFERALTVDPLWTVAKRSFHFFSNVASISSLCLSKEERESMINSVSRCKPLLFVAQLSQSCFGNGLVWTLGGSMSFFFTSMADQRTKSMDSCDASLRRERSSSPTAVARRHRT